jgi:tetratricopeptide (TPR) repeat protein
MRSNQPTRTELISAVKELATASSSDGLQAVLTRYRFLCSLETDQQLTHLIHAGLERDELASVSVLFTVRGFLTHLRSGDSLESAVRESGGLSLFQVAPIAQLMRDPKPSPHNAEHQANLCRRALKIVRRDTEPNLWAYLHFVMANRLVLAIQDQDNRMKRHRNLYLLPTERLVSGHMLHKIQEAMDAYEVAGDVWKARGEMEQATQACYELARLLIHFSSGEQKIAALQRAIELLESTGDIWTHHTHRQKWGDVQAALGLALANMPDGLDADMLERAIGHFEAALEMPSGVSIDPSFEKAGRQHQLAILYTQRYRGDRVAYVEHAIELFQKALVGRTRADYPEEWADTQNSLANALQQRLRGDPAQNMEQAIEAYQTALQVWTRNQNPANWAMIQRNLAEAYRQRVLGRSEENQEKAIEHFDSALSVYNRQDHPTQWASVHNSLANLYCNRLRGDRADNIEKGIQCYEQALQVYTRRDYPRQCAQTTNNLANAYCERKRDDHSDNLHTAITLYQQVLEVRTFDDYPREWAATHNNIGTAYAGLGEWKRASKHFRKALEVRTVSALPDKALQSARNLGALHFRLGQWDEAISAYRTAQEASDALYRQAITEIGKRAEIGRGREVTHPLAYALAWKGKLREAVLELEHGRARLLAEALARDRVALEQASDKDRTEYEKGVSRIRALQSELRAAELDAQGATDAPGTARPFAEIAEELSVASKDRDRILEAVGRVSGDESLLAQPRFAAVEEAVQPDMPLIYLTATSVGGLALVVHAKGIKRIWFDGLTDKVLLEHVQEWFGIYFAYRKALGDYEKARKELVFRKISGREKETILRPLRLAVESTRQVCFAILEDTTRWLWEVVMGQLVATLRGLDYQRATLIPTGLLAFLPLHAAWHPKDDGSSRHYALDEVAFTYAPSARALTHAQRIATDVPGKALFAVENPDGSLRYAAQEVVAVERYFSEPWTVRGEQATFNTVKAALPQCDVYHFACHGNSNWQSPLESALGIAYGVRFTLDSLLSLEEKRQARLAFLSACETGLIGVELPDEVVGLAAGFMQAGTAGVVSTLWAVNDKSTALLVGQFYKNWREQGMSLLEALVTAQRWLRDESGRDRWRHPYYWAALTLTGV